MTHKIRKAVFPVAGRGTRFLPATKAIPKEMLPILNKPLIQWAVEEAAAAGISEFIFIIAPDKEAILNHFQPQPDYEAFLTTRGKMEEVDLLKAGLPENARITPIIQNEALGLGHAIYCARDAIGDEPFAVILPDDMVKAETGCLTQMMRIYKETGGAMLAIEEVAQEDTARYGIIAPHSETDEGFIRIKGLVEKPTPQDAPSQLAVIGRYILTPNVLARLGDIGTGAGGEIQLTDAIAASIDGNTEGNTDANTDATPLYGFRFAGQRFDCGSKAGYLCAQMAYALDDDELKDALDKQMRHADE